MEKTIKWILWLAAIGLLILVGWRYVVAPKADASFTRRDWSGSKYTEWSACETELQCGGVVEGTQTRTKYRVCEFELWGTDHCTLNEKQVLEVQYQKCEVELPVCIEDQCINLEGVQETVPEGMEQEKTEEGLVCNPFPVPTPEPQPVVRTYDGPHGAPQEPTCKDLGGYAPTITSVSRVDRDTVRAEYTSPSPNSDKFLIWYGLSPDNLGWNTITRELWVELSGEELVGKHVWLNVRAMSEGCTGVQSETVDP